MNEGERIFRICNACRYCEGFCAVYPAVERRTTFPAVDLNYLANLCHNCGECYDACQYAPPHEFAVNVPQLLARIRLQSYRQYVWPGIFARAYQENGLVIAALLALCISLILFAAPADFYAMTGLFSAAGLFVAVSLSVSGARFWRDCGEPLRFGAVRRVINDVLSLRYLGGKSRRWFHHLTFYGLVLCFASTAIAAIYHYAFHWHAPYGYLTAPVFLGTIGGLAMMAGTAGLFSLTQRRDPAKQDAAQLGMDTGFLVLLFGAGVTGLLLLAFRDTRMMPKLLAIHLGVVLTLFLTLPYGKFVHGIYRSAALLKNALENGRTR